MNTYHFLITYWFSKHGQSEYSKPIQAETYAEALERLYKDTRITGALLVALREWSGFTVIDKADLSNAAQFDVPNLALV